MPATRRRILKAQNSEVALHRLPDEVLSVIFQLGVLSHDWDDMAIIEHLSTISGVCSRWRHAALSCPVLWTSIILCNPETTLVKRNTQSRIRTYLQRSKKAFINIKFYLEPQDYDGSKFIAFFRKVIAPHISHCRVLDLAVNTSAQMRSILPLEGSLDSLSSLQCDLGNAGSRFDRSWTGTPTPLSLLREENNDAQLRSFKLYSKSPVSLEHVNGSNMLDICIKGSVELWADTLKLVSRSSSTLENLTIHFADSPPPDVYSSGQLLIADVSSKMVLRNLKRLTCSAKSLGTGLARALDMPNLTHLRLNDMNTLMGSRHAAQDEAGTIVKPLPIRPFLGHIPRLQSLYLGMSGSYGMQQIIVDLFVDYSSIVLLEINGWGDRTIRYMLQILVAGAEDWEKIANGQPPLNALRTPRDPSSSPSLPLFPALRVMRFSTLSYYGHPMTELEWPIDNALAHRPAMRIEHNDFFLDGSDVEPKELEMILKKLEEDKNIIKPR